MKTKIIPAQYTMEWEVWINGELIGLFSTREEAQKCLQIQCDIYNVRYC